MRVLVTGIAGKIGRLVGSHLLARGHDVSGIDIRRWSDPPAGIEVHNHDIRKRGAEEVFRKIRPEAVVHMATVTHLGFQSEDRYRINLHGTRAVFDHCDKYGARYAVFVGRHTYYGAAYDSPLYHKEEDPPTAVARFPELADLVAADLYAATALWRLPELCTSVLRFCYTLGPSLTGTLANYLRGPRVPTVLGFDPLFQFMHDEDVAEAICVALDRKLRGVFNVAGPDPIPLSKVVEGAHRQRVPVPELVFRFALGRFGLPKIPTSAVAHLKYPVVMDTTAFKTATGFVHKWDDEATFESFYRATSTSR